MDFIGYAVIVALTILLIKQMQYLRNVTIRTLKSTTEVSTLLAGVIALSVLTYFFAKNMLHYCAAFIGIAYVIVQFYKQGICEAGVLTVSRGKELYLWGELGNIKIDARNVISVEYYTPTGAKIISHQYKRDDYEQIIKLLERNSKNYV